MENILKLLCRNGIITLFCLGSTCNLYSQDYNKATVYVDSNIVAKYYFEKGQLKEFLCIDTSMHKTDSIKYQYDNDGAITKVTLSDNSVSGSNPEMEKNQFDNFISNKQYISKLGIKLPLDILNQSELSDIVYLLSINEHINDTNNDSLRTINIDSINMSYRFYPSNLEGFISGDDTVVKYTLIVTRNNISKETIKFNRGVLNRTYIWVNKDEFNVEIICKYFDGREAITRKTIFLSI